MSFYLWLWALCVCVIVVLVCHWYLFSSLQKKIKLSFFMCTETGTWIVTDVKLKYIQEQLYFPKRHISFFIEVIMNHFLYSECTPKYCFYCKYWQEWIFPSCTHILTGSENSAKVLGTLVEAINILSFLKNSVWRMQKLHGRKPSILHAHLFQIKWLVKAF